ncbi:uncharacterized protein LOC132741493 [Ruditapes philippinarum]|uniref:uncharacterized protein LOC132741493 n=1 Tax=Ruditapes philippinarum TaxID=129788 RepID=UPI00295AAD8B|nr:uncharacterized protein LOC132741493 [Ruditapes philippinarum]
MELQNWSISMLVLCFVYKALGEDILETRASIAAFKGHRVTLPCKFTTTSTGEWMFIRWTRTYNDSVINLANIQNNVFSANWAPGAPEDFRDHVELHKSIKDGEYSLDLIIDGFRCSDIGLYTCDVFTMTSSSNIVSESNLEMKANPGQPSITTNTIEVKENDTFRIECNSNVGIPASTISWWYTLPDASHIYQKVTEGIVQELTSTEDCSNTAAMSTLTLTMSAELDGAVFVCSPTLDVGEDGKPQNADEVKIILYGKETTTQSTAAPTTIKATITTEVSSANNASLQFSAILLSCLVTIFNLYFTRAT